MNAWTHCDVCRWIVASYAGSAHHTKDLPERGRAAEILNGDNNRVHSMHAGHGAVPGLMLGKWQICRQWGRHARRRGAPSGRLPAAALGVRSKCGEVSLPRTHLHTHRFMRRRENGSSGWRDRSMFGDVTVHVCGWSRGRPAHIPGTHPAA